MPRLPGGTRTGGAVGAGGDDGCYICWDSDFKEWWFRDEDDGLRYRGSTPTASPGDPRHEVSSRAALPPAAGSGGGSTLYVSAKVCGGQLMSLPGQHISRSNAHLTPKRRIRYY